MTRDEAARHLAELHFNVDPSTTAIYRVVSTDEDSRFQEPIKLLVVNEYTFPMEGIWPLGFDPTPASGNYPTILMEITPRQFLQLKANELQLPQEWKLAENITPALVSNGEPAS